MWYGEAGDSQSGVLGGRGSKVLPCRASGRCAQEGTLRPAVPGRPSATPFAQDSGRVLPLEPIVAPSKRSVFLFFLFFF